MLFSYLQECVLTDYFGSWIFVTWMLQGVYVALIGVYIAYFVAAMVITHEKKVKDPTPLIVVTAVTATFITIWLIRKHFGKQIQENLVFHVVFFFEQREKMVKALKM